MDSFDKFMIAGLTAINECFDKRNTVYTSFKAFQTELDKSNKFKTASIKQILEIYSEHKKTIIVSKKIKDRWLIDNFVLIGKGTKCFKLSLLYSYLTSKIASEKNKKTISKYEGLRVALLSSFLSVIYSNMPIKEQIIKAYIDGDIDDSSNESSSSDQTQEHISSSGSSEESDESEPVKKSVKKKIINKKPIKKPVKKKSSESSSNELSGKSSDVSSDKSDSSDSSEDDNINQTKDMLSSVFKSVREQLFESIGEMEKTIEKPPDGVRYSSNAIAKSKEQTENIKAGIKNVESMLCD
jgi:hypothetical protein